MRSTTWLGVLAVQLALTGVFGCGDECAADADCLSTERCTSGKCVAAPVRPPLPPAADAGPVDVGFPDSGVHPDAAELPEAGVSDAGPDSGVFVDGGPVPDGGPVVGTPENAGLIELSIISTSTGPTPRAFANFIQFATTATVVPFPSAPDSCSLVDRRATSGVGTGIDVNTTMANGFAISGFIAGPSPMPVSFTRASAGVYSVLPDQLRTQTIWYMNQTLTYTIPPTTTAGQLRPGTASLSADMPTELAVEPGPRVALTLGAADIDFTWTGLAVAGVRVVFQLSDTRSQLVLRCDSANDGRLRIPRAAQQFFLARGLRPFRAEMAVERSADARFEVLGGGPVPTTVRHRVGVRYSVQ